MKKITFTLLMIMLLLTLVGCGHKHEYTDEVVAPTCTEKGYTKHTCECGDVYNDSEVQAKGHSFGEWNVVKEATEKEKGSKERTCSECSEKETEEIPMLEHTHKYTDVVTDPTCKEQGYTTHTCECGESYVDAYTEVIEHTYDSWTVLKEATFFEEGLKEGVCSVCEEVKQEVVPMLEIEGLYRLELVTNKDEVIWPSRAATSREEIISELFKDLYEWAKSNGETKSYEEYETWVKEQISGSKDINIRNTTLGEKKDEEGNTKYFLNIPEYFDKWNDFFKVFNEAMLKVNSAQKFWVDTYAATVRLDQFIKWTSTGQRYFNSYLTKMCESAKIPLEIPRSYEEGQEVVLPELALKNGLEFLGWFDNPEFSGNPIEKIAATEKGHKKFYAKWEPETFVEKVEINTIDDLLIFTTHQLVWTITPSDATDLSLEFSSSDENIAKIDRNGLITAVTYGYTTISVKVNGNHDLDFTFELNVCAEDYIDGSYETLSYVKANETINLKAEIIRSNHSKVAPTWSSLDPSIATVDNNGVVTGVSEGVAKIVATDPNNAELKLEFAVTVLNEMPTGILDLALRANNSNVYSIYDLLIGWTYNIDIFGSVSKLLANDALVKNTNYYDTANKQDTNYGEMKSTEFITVHYTGNMASGATAAANASYMSSSKDVSIHYVTGNDGVFYCLDEKLGAWHAGDSGAMNQVGEFKWIATGVKVKDGDPLYPEFTISNDFYYEINGQKTKVPMPKPWNYSSRNTDHIMNSDGTLSSKAGYGQTAFSNRAPEEFINDLDLPFTIKNGEYYMGTTWWCYTQVYEGRICSTGGNRNSIGIESCVNQGTDLWYTWQKTAQLVADIMVRQKLDITRVRGHHFFSGKDCPQPMLENNNEIWWEFLGLVEAEYELLTKYEGYTVSIESSNTDVINNKGRVISQPTQTTGVTYTITFTKGSESQSITLASMVKGVYVDR